MNKLLKQIRDVEPSEFSLSDQSEDESLDEPTVMILYRSLTNRIKTHDSLNSQIPKIIS